MQIKKYMEWMIKIYKVMGTSLAPDTNYGSSGLTTFPCALLANIMHYSSWRLNKTTRI